MRVNHSHPMRKQTGITVMGFVFVLVVFSFAGFIGLKLLPVYMESFQIDKAITAVIESDGVEKQTKMDIVISVVKRMDIDGVTLFNDQTYKEFMKVKRDDGRVSLEVAYKKEVPLFANITLVADFQKYVAQE